MPANIKMPKLSDTMTEGTLVAWKVKPGDAVKPEDVLGEVETDKAVMPIENFETGTVASLLIAEGQAVPVGHLIAVIAAAGEDWQQVAAGGTSTAGTSTAASGTTAKKAAGGLPAAAVTAGASTATLLMPDPSAGASRVKASPLARKTAMVNAIDLATIHGTGPNGRVVQADVLNALAQKSAVRPALAEPASAAAAPASPSPTPAPLPDLSAIPGDTEIKITGLRKVIAQRLVESKTTIPHFYVEMEIDAAGMVEFRESLKARMPDFKFTFNDLVIRGVALSLRKVPQVNASWAGDRIIQRGSVDVGMGVAIDGGLVVPVIRHADRLSLSQVAAKARELIDKAKERKLKPDEMTGSTFTISNMGMYGVSRFSAIVNPPESAILAVGAIRKEPVVQGSSIVIGHRMSMTLSADHRAIDGALAATFLVELRKYLEQPLTMLV